MDDDLASLVLEDAKEKMAKTVEHVKLDFGAVRTGRAAPALVEGIQVDYYGTMTPLKSLASFTVPEARMLVVAPFDKGSMAAIEKAISASELGITPSNDGQVIRLAFPPLTEERRRDLVKVVRQKAEDGKVQIRSHRRASRHELDQLEKESGLSSDEHERLAKQLEKMTHTSNEAIDELLAHKERELLDVG
jgi:ribosome recycling factor